MTKIIQNFVGIVLGLSLVCLFVFALIAALDKQSEVTCIKLQSQSEEYRDFYLTESEKQRCDAAGIEIDTTVRDSYGAIIR